MYQIEVIVLNRMNNDDKVIKAIAKFENTNNIDALLLV